MRTPKYETESHKGRMREREHKENETTDGGDI